MSSRFHNKYHRHNHHTYPSSDARFPDSSHDPIASPDSPFIGDFVVSGGLSAMVPSASAYVAALYGNVGINTSTPNVELTIVGSVSSTANTLTKELSVFDSAYVGNYLGIGTISPLAPLHVVGNALITGNLSAIGSLTYLDTLVQVTMHFL